MSNKLLAAYLLVETVAMRVVTVLGGAALIASSHVVAGVALVCWAGADISLKGLAARRLGSRRGV